MEQHVESSLSYFRNTPRASLSCEKIILAQKLYFKERSNSWLPQENPTGNVHTCVLRC